MRLQVEQKQEQITEKLSDDKLGKIFPKINQLSPEGLSPNYDDPGWMQNKLSH